MSKLYVVGIGPGAYEQMTIKAAKILEECDIIVGYTVYVELLKPHFPDKCFLTTPMRQETLRCRLAFEEAEKGKKTALVCSGDAGIYGMAGLAYELKEEYPATEVEVIAGVTAALGGGAVLGAPLGHDCCLISLSDLMTSWETIEKRILAAAAADFAVCIYNPSSKKRSDYLAKACELLLRYKSPNTICGIVRNIARDGEEKTILTLQELSGTPTDMFCAVFVGDSQTKIIDGNMVTPRGYRI